MYSSMLSRRHSIPSAGLVVGLALALSLAGITEKGPSSQAVASSAACPAGWTLNERAIGVADIPWPAYCERTVTHLGIAQQIQLSSFGADLQLIAYGGVGGVGGSDGGLVGGAAGPVGSVSGTLAVTPGSVITISTGGAGGAGTLGGNDPVSGGTSGQSASARNGGVGGAQGCTFGACGADRSRAGTGGGGGAATVVEVSGVQYIAAGGGGGGGANLPGHGSVSGNGRPGITGSLATTVSGAAGAGGGAHSPAGGGGGGGLLGGNGGSMGFGGSAGSNFAGADLTESYIGPSSIQRAVGDSTRNGFVVLRQIAVPVVSQIVELSNLSTSSATQFTFEVRFSEPVTGFGLEDVALSGTAGGASGWTLAIEPVTGGQVYRVLASHVDAPSGTIELTALATGVQAGDRTGVGQVSSAMTIDRTPPTVSSMAIIPDLSNAKRVRITLQFSEAISAIDANLIELGSAGSNWTRSNATISGSSYSFDATYATLISEDIKVAVGVGAATDLAGNLNTTAREFAQLVDLTTPTASFSASTYRLNSSSTTQNLTLNFDRPVWGLISSDLTFSSLCTLGAVSPASGPASIYTVPITCSGAGTATLTLTPNAVKDFASNAGPAAPLSVTVIRDTTPPTISSVVGKQVADAIEYSVTFSEEISSFPASAISTSGSPATGTWTYSTPVRVGNTNQWTFTAVNPSPVNGNHVPVFNSTTTILDLAGNALTTNPSFSGLAVQFLPTYTVGTLSPLGADAVALAPNFDLDLKGGKIHSIRLTNNSWATSGSTKDVFSNLPSGSMGNSLGTSNSNGVIEITAPNATEAQWEAAIRAIRFDAGSSSGIRNFTYHIKPVSGYDYASGAMFERITQGTALGHAQAKTLASEVNRFGYQGYLATPNSASQAEAAKNATMIGNSGLFLWLDLKRPTGSTVVSDSGLSRDVAAGDANFTNWDTAYPGYPQPELGVGENFVFANKANGKWHDAFATDNNALGYVVEFGLRGTEDLPALLSQSVSAEVDASVPEVVSVSSLTTDGTYVVGETIRIEVEMSEATLVTGTPRLKLNTAPTVRYASYVSGSGTDKLVFEYTVQAGDTSPDLNYSDTASLEPNLGTLKDTTGNNAIRTLPATSSANSLGGGAELSIDANRFIAQTFSLGAMPSIGLNVIAIAPQFDLEVRGNNNPFGIRITNKTFDPSASNLDAFILNPVPTGVQVVTNAAGVIELYSETLDEAGWEAAIRAIKFDAGSSQVAPEFDFHLRPLKAYDYTTGHAYRYVSMPGTAHPALKAHAEASTLAGFPGYLANPTSQAETNLIVSTVALPTGATPIAVIGLEKQAPGTGPSTPVKVVFPASQAGIISYLNWRNPEASTAGDMCTQIYSQGDWNDFPCNTTEHVAGYLAEYGGNTPDTNFLGLMVASHTYEVDLTPPTVTSVTALSPDGDYVAGQQISIRVRFSEPITVTGNPQLKLDMGPNVRPVTCNAGVIDTDLVCNYTIQQGDVTTDLNYLDTSALILNGGAIVDAGANPAVLTLPALNAAQSLGGSSDLEIDGNRNELTLSAASPTSTSRNLVFTVTSTLPIDCSSLSTQDGVDLRFTGISSIQGISASGDNRTCTINALSSVLPGQYGVSSLERASSFSVNDLQNPPIATTTLRVQNATVDVEVPAQAGQGFVIVNPVAGQRRTIFEKELPSIVAPPEMSAGRAALDRNNVLAPPAGTPGSRVEGDFSQATSRVDAKTREQITAGDKVVVTLAVDSSMAATHEVIVYFRSTLDPASMGWAYLGKRDFDVNGLAVSEPMVFTKVGTYYLKLIVIQKGTQFRMTALAPGLFGRTSFVMPAFGLGVVQQGLGYLASTTPILDADLPAGVQILEVAVEVIGTEPTVTQNASSDNNSTTPASPAPVPAPEPSPIPATPAPSPTPVPTPELEPLPTPAPQQQAPITPVAPAAPDSPSDPGPADPAPEPQPAPEPETENVQEEEIAAASVAPEPEATLVLESYDPFGTPEAVKETTGLLSAFAAVGALAAAAGAAAAAAAAAGAAGSAASGSNGGLSGAEMSEDSLDALAGADFELDVFADSKDRWGDKLALWAIPILSFLDRPTLNATRRVARYSPLVSKLLNDGSYLRAMLGSLSLLPTIAAIVLAVIGLTQNQEILLHPPVWIFIAILVIGLFDSFAGAMGVLVFILGSLPLLDVGEITDWRMLSGIAVAGFGPILLARSIRNFRRKAPRDASGWLDRIGDIGFASLMGGWISGLVLRALPALTGLAVPAADYVVEVQIIATIAIAVRILLEDLAARFYPSRMDDLTPDTLPEPFRFQPAIVMVFRYLFYVFIASAFMGTGFIVLVAAALFLVPNLLGFITDKLPRVEFLTKWLPSGLPAIAMILGLEIVLENTLSTFFGDHPEFSTIFIFGLLALIIFLTVLGMLGRPEPNQPHWLQAPEKQTIYRVGGFVTFLLLVWFTSQL